MLTPEMKTALCNFKLCANDAPEGTYEQAKALEATIGELAEDLMRKLRDLGLKADTCDLVYAVEVAMYNYAKQSNPDNPLFPTAEGFGAAMDSPARDRVIAQAENNRDFLRSIGKIQ